MQVRSKRTRKRARGLAVAGAVTFSLVVGGAALAAVSTTPDAAVFAGAVSDGVAPTGATFSVAYPCVVDDAATPEDDSNCPTGVGNTPLAGFPTKGFTYGLLTTGNAAYADDANTATNTGWGWGVAGSTAIGVGVYDYQVVRIDLPAATTSCLAFDFRFMSDEFPEYVDNGYNDAFIAQLNTWNVAADPATQTVSAPGNFAGGAGDVISVDGGGPSAMTDAAALGVTYDGATPLLTARTPVNPGTTNSVFLTVFDQGDTIYDSATFVDNLRYEDIDPKLCKSLSLDPFDGTTGITLVSGKAPKLSKDFATLTIPLACNLPPGPISCSVTAKATFTATSGRTLTARQSALLAGILLARGKATIAPNTVGNLAMKTKPDGVAAVKAAIKKPAKLKAQARALIKKAKKLRAQGQIARAKRLEEKAAKLIKRARALQKKPLGTVTLTVTNPANGVTQTFKVTLPRP